jgi:hypothetical protein
MVRQVSSWSDITGGTGRPRNGPLPEAAHLVFAARTLRFLSMTRFRTTLLAGVCLAAFALVGCEQASERSRPEPTRREDSPVQADGRSIARDTQKTAKDIGTATNELAGRAGRGFDNATSEVAADSQDAWITTKVKSTLTSSGYDPLHMHVDTNEKIVTLSGSVDSPAKERSAVTLAKAVSGVVGVKDHLFVGPHR